MPEHNPGQAKEKVTKAAEQAAGGHYYFPYQAKKQMGEMVEAIFKADQNYSKILSGWQKPAIKGGFMAEEFHAETFTLDAILKGDGSYAITDKYKLEWQAQGRKPNDVPDILIIKKGQVVSEAQLKFYQTAEASGTKVSDPKYEDMGQLVVPSDQVVEAREYASPEAAPKIDGQVRYEEVSSTPLTKEQADQMGGGDLSNRNKVVNEYQTNSTIQQMGKAAKGAAAMSAVVCGSINILTYIQAVRAGKISQDEAVVNILVETAASAADSAVKAAANAGIQSLITRYGEKALVENLAKQSAKALLKSNVVTVGVVCAVDAVKDLVRLGLGDITKDEFYERQGKGLMTVPASTLGGTLGLAGATALAEALGAGATAVTAAGLIGGLAGGLIAGLALTLAIENGIEKPYRDLVQNTTYLHEAAGELERVSQTVLMGQVLFTKFIEADTHWVQQFKTQLGRIGDAGQKALASVMKV